MKLIYKPCPYCKGKGSFPVIANENTTAQRAGEFTGYYEKCKYCDGTGRSDEILGFEE